MRYVANKCWMMVGTERLSLATLPKFGLLIDILLINEDKLPILVYEVATTVGYQPKHGAYQIVLNLEQILVFFVTSILSRTIAIAL